MISIVVPVYNSEKYICRCVNSLLNQSYNETEIILIDDGSSDNSKAICDDYAKKHSCIKTVHTKNNGVSSARNLGVELASGEYISFCDSDDFCEKDYLKQLLYYSEKYADYLVFCGYSLGKREEKICYSENEFDIILKQDFIKVFNRDLLNSPVNKLYKTSILKNNKIIFEKALDLGEDLLFNLKYLKNVNGLISVNHCLYWYNDENANSLSSKYRKNMYEIQMYLFNELKKSADDFNADCDEQYYKMYFKILNNVMRNNINSNTSFVKAISLNNKILKNDKMLKSMKYEKVHEMSHMYLRVYKIGYYPLIRLYQKLSCFKNRFLSRRAK